MAVGDFNEESEKPEFIYRKKPDVERSYFICQYKDGKNDYEPIGDYTVLDLDEEIELTEKRLMNLMAVMNKRKRTIDLSTLTNARILFTIIPVKPEDTHQKVIFRTHDGTGVSQENAIMVIDRGVLNE
ncbi:MAG: hypothetical protein ACLFR0_05175 [Alphaproteobacteria bacterium]